jgi:hypothetical protein
LWRGNPFKNYDVKRFIDADQQEPGQHMPTGSTAQTVEIPHAATLRISTLKMYPMSLYERGESNGAIFLQVLPDSLARKTSGCKDTAEQICAGE